MMTTRDRSPNRPSPGMDFDQSDYLCQRCSREASSCSCTDWTDSPDPRRGSDDPAAKKRRTGDSDNGEIFRVGGRSRTTNRQSSRTPGCGRSTKTVKLSKESLLKKFDATSFNIINDSAISLAGQEQWYFENIFQIASPSVALQGMDHYLQIWLGLTLGTLSLLQRPQFLDSALRALALTNVAQRTPGADQDFKLDSNTAKGESFYQYHQALATLTPGIHEMKKNASSPNALAATMLLTYFEMFACTSDDAWYAHATGAETLVRMRGTTRTLLTPESRAMFMAFRPPLIISAMLNGLPCFLAEDDWRRVMRAIHLKRPDRSFITDVSEQVYDEFVQLPGLMAQVDTARELLSASRETESAGYAIRVLSELLQLRWALDGIFEDFMQKLHVSGQQPHISGIAGPFWRSMTAPNLLPFVNPLVGSVLCFIWSTKLLLNSRLAALHSSLGAVLPAPDTVPGATSDETSTTPESGSRSSIAELRAESVTLALSIYNAIKSIGTRDVPGHLGHSLKIAYYALKSSPISQESAAVQIRDISRYFAAAKVGDSRQERRLKELSSIE